MPLDLGQIKRAFIITDTHLGVRNNSNEWIEIHRKFFFEWFIPMCRKNYRPGDCLVHLGDVFDSRQSLNLKVLNMGIEIFEELSKIFHDGIYIICGNHDIYGRNSNDINSLKALKWIPRVNIYEDPISIKFGNKNVFLMPWRKDHAEESNCLKTVDSHDYLFCHTDIRGLMFNKFTKIEEGISYQDLDKFERVYSGHVHYAQKYGKVRMLGSPYQLTRSDSENPKGITILDFMSGDEKFFENPISPKFIRIPFETVLNSTPSELDSIFENNLVDILIDPQIAVKCPLGILSDMVTSPIKITFTPISNLEESVESEDLIFDLDGKNFSILDLVGEYLKSTSFDDNKREKIYKTIKVLYNKVAAGQDKEEKEDENSEN
jgi:DNA repair exonuclease SbcCD nuclease subunit